MALSTTPETKTGSSAAEAVEARLAAIAELLVYGASQQDILALVQKQWGVSLRTAQEDLRTVRQRLAGEAATEDQLLSLRVSQLQRDKLVGLALRYMLNPPEDLDPKLLQSLASLLTAVRGLLDSRDRTAMEIQQVVEERLNSGTKVTPALEASDPAVTANGHAPAVVSCANGKRRVRRPRRANAPAQAARAPDANSALSSVAIRPPLPADNPVAAAVGKASASNRCTAWEIEHECRRSAVVEVVCAGCAASP
jgi:hypothetical protein